MTTVILILGVLLCVEAGIIGYDWVVIDSLKAKIKRRDLIMESLIRANRAERMKNDAKVGIVVESDTTYNGQENTL